MEHVRNQNWTAVGLDFLIVVIGVFIGIQFSNWNDARRHEKSERVYIERIREDLLANQDDLRQRLSYFQQTRAHALATLDALDRPTDSLGVQFLIDAYQSSQITQREVGRDTYEEIVSVGANSAISDVDVRKRIANFYSSINAHLTTMGGVTAYRELIRRTMPYDAQAAIRSACDDVVETNEAGLPTITLPANCAPELDSEAVSSAVAAIVSGDVRNDLVRRISDLDGKLSAAQLIIDRARLLDDYLAGVHR
jgi:hypothetical protein